MDASGGPGIASKYQAISVEKKDKPVNWSHSRKISVMYELSRLPPHWPP